MSALQDFNFKEQEDSFFEGRPHRGKWAYRGVPPGGIRRPAHKSEDITCGLDSGGAATLAELTNTVENGLSAYYEFVATQLHKWVDPLSNEQFWRKPYPYGNSVGHLVLHLTGNLNYYIGARIAETGYVRDRDR